MTQTLALEQPTLFKIALKCHEIQMALYFEHDKSQSIIALNTTKALHHEADVLVLRKSGVTIEFEVKVSYADFMADFRKADKHKQMQRGEKGGPQYFFYACEPGVIPLGKVPDYAGLVHVTRHYFPNRSNTYMDHRDKVMVVKEAPRLHKETNPGIHERLCRSLMYKAIHNSHA